MAKFTANVLEFRRRILDDLFLSHFLDVCHFVACHLLNWALVAIRACCSLFDVVCFGLLHSYFGCARTRSDKCCKSHMIALAVPIHNFNTQQIGDEFGKSLVTAMLERTANQHLANFVKDIASCPVSISLCGFLTLDHSLIVSVSQH